MYPDFSIRAVPVARRFGSYKWGRKEKGLGAVLQQSHEEGLFFVAWRPTFLLLFLLGAWLERATGFLDVILEIVLVSVLLLAVKTGLAAGLAAVLAAVLLLVRSRAKASAAGRR